MIRSENHLRCKVWYMTARKVKACYLGQIVGKSASPMALKAHNCLINLEPISPLIYWMSEWNYILAVMDYHSWWWEVIYMKATNAKNNNVIDVLQIIFQINGYLRYFRSVNERPLVSGEFHGLNAKYQVFVTPKGRHV